MLQVFQGVNSNYQLYQKVLELHKEIPALERSSWAVGVCLELEEEGAVQNQGVGLGETEETDSEQIRPIVRQV